MKIIDAHWDSSVNVLKIKCECGNEFEQRTDRWKVFCPQCGLRENLKALREKFVSEGGFKQ